MTNPLNNLIQHLKYSNNGFISFDILKNELQRKQKNGTTKYNITIRENDDLALLFYDKKDYNFHSHHQYRRNMFVTDLENYCKSVIIDKKTLEIIVSTNNNIVYNPHPQYFKNIKWDSVCISEIKDGTPLILFYHNGEWIISTRRCLSSKFHGNMFLSSIKKMKFELNDCDKNLCYHFVLIHHSNKNIVNYSYLDDEYSEVYHIKTTVKYSDKEANVQLCPPLPVVTQNFCDIYDVYKKVNIASEFDRKNKIVSFVGYRIKYGDEIVEIQNPVYLELKKVKNSNNIHQVCLELYQKDILDKYIVYLTRKTIIITKRINISFDVIAKEILDLYHSTRNWNNSEAYGVLTNSYKGILFEIHGHYIDKKRNNGEFIVLKDVVDILKKTKSYNLRQLYYDRLLTKKKLGFKECVFADAQAHLMNK